MKAFIVDDERLARRELRRLLAAHPDVEVVGEAGDPAEAGEAIEQAEPDVLFLDIHMPRMNGFALLESLERAPQVVFTTAHEAHALQAFEVGAMDYLLKPIRPERLTEALARVAERLDRDAPALAYASSDRPVLVRDGTRSWFVRLDDIARFESVGNYVQLHIGPHRPLLLRSLNQLEARLDPDRFARANRREIVNLAFVESIETGPRGEVQARLQDGTLVTFSRRSSQEFRRRRSL